MSMTKAMTSDERVLRSNCERVVKAKLDTFWEVGVALATIMERKLYRETHANFDVYCTDVFGFTAKSARRMVRAVEVQRQLPAGVTITISGSDALSPVDPADRADVATQAANDDGVVTRSGVQDVIAPAVDPADRFNEIIKILRDAKKRVSELAADDSGAFMQSDTVITDLRNAISGLKFSKPHAKCCYCNGKGCESCNGLGWLPKGIYDAADDDLKKACA